MRHLIIAGLIVGGASAAAQTPAVQHAVVETRVASSIATEVAAAGRNATPTWLAWRVPLVAGDRDVCSSWRDDEAYVRGTQLEPARSFERPSFPPRSGSTVALEGGTTLIVLLRVIDGKPERLRTASDDCPLDAGGRAFVWLTGVSAPASVAYLETLLGQRALDTDVGERTARSAIGAIALHADPSADTVLTRLLSPGTARALRVEAINGFARARGSDGIDRLLALVRTEPDSSVRRAMTTAVGEARSPRASTVLRGLTRDDADAAVRSEAAYWYVQTAGESVIAEVLQWLAAEKEESVQRRALSAVLRLPGGAGVTPLIQLARNSTNARLKVNAVRALGESSDARATAFMRELIAN